MAGSCDRDGGRGSEECVGGAVGWGGVEGNTVVTLLSRALVVSGEWPIHQQDPGQLLAAPALRVQIIIVLGSRCCCFVLLPAKIRASVRTGLILQREGLSVLWKHAASSS